MLHKSSFMGNYVAGNDKMYEGLHVKCPVLYWNKRISVCSWPSWDIQHGETDFKDKEVISQCLCFCVAVKHFSRSDGINQLWSSENACLCSCRSFPACKSNLLYAVFYCHPWPVWLYRVFSQYLIFGTIIGKSYWTHNNVCFDFLYSFCVNIFSFREEFIVMLHLHSTSCKVPVFPVLF